MKEYSGEEMNNKLLFESCLENLTSALFNLKEDSEIAKLRSQISSECEKRANELEKSSGIYRLDLPTGVGKTISAMCFTLSRV